MALVSIVIPTLNRPLSLARAMRSAVGQVADGDGLEVVIVDNSAEGSARDIVHSFQHETTPVTFVSEPKPGVATARNAGVRAAKGEWIVFLDDDEEAQPGWIAALLGAARATGADAVFGPVTAQAEAGASIGALAPYFSRNVDSADLADISAMAAYLGTNNSMFHRRWLGGAPFDETLNETGGEDSLLLQRIVHRGGKLVWAKAAGVTEWAPEKRLNWSYVRRRKFLSGQIRVFVQHMLGPAHWPQIPLWMAVGLVQFIGATAGALLLSRLAPNRAQQLAATASGGLGKILWAPRFRPALYGSGLVS